MATPAYNYHAGFYRSVQPDESLTKPWENTPFNASTILPSLSPLKPVFALPPDVVEKDAGSPSVASMMKSPIISVYKVPTKPKGLLNRIRQFFGLPIPPIQEDVPIAFAEPTPPLPLQDKVQLHEWKEYGYWAMPYLNNVTVDNIPDSVPIPISTPELRERILSLRDPETDQGHPEHWVPGVTHRSLPPRPTRWKDPIPGQPLPFPWEVQINPILQHHLWGPPPLRWCIIDRPLPGTMSTLFGRTYSDIPCNHPDFAQPATWPFLTHMHFNAVAGDSAPRYPWPFTIENLKGITVGDVLRAVYEQFRIEVDPDERCSWPRFKQIAAIRAHEERCKLMTPPFEQLLQDPMRRSDALGWIMWFRGIEPTIDGGGWMITFGTH